MNQKSKEQRLIIYTFIKFICLQFGYIKEINVFKLKDEIITDTLSYTVDKKVFTFNRGTFFDPLLLLKIEEAS